MAALQATQPTPSPSDRLAQTFRGLRHRNFRLFLGGQVVSLIGTWMQTTAQSWLIYRLTHSEFLLGLAWFCTQIPVLLVGPLGGWAADRWSRHRIVVITQGLSMVQAGLLAALTLSGKVEVWHVLALAVALGLINAFDVPARQSLLIQMTSKEDLLNSISLNSGTFNAARTVGPALAGILVARLGEGICFLTNSLSFVAVIASLLAMRLEVSSRTPSAESPVSGMVSGFRYAWGHPKVRAVLVMMSAMTICGMPLVVLLPVFADLVLHRGATGLGWLASGMGIGSMIGVLTLAGRVRTSGLAEVIAYSSGCLGLALIFFGLSASFQISMTIIIIIGFCTFRQLVSANTLIQTLIEDSFRGRVMALYSMCVIGLGPIGSVLAGAAAEHFGAPTTMLVTGMATATASILFRLHLRRQTDA